MSADRSTAGIVAGRLSTAEYTANFADHPAVVLVGDPRSGEWTRFFGFPGSDQILARVKQLQATRERGPLATSN